MMDIELEIEGLHDRRLTDAIRHRVRLVRRQFARSGEWRVTISPSEARGEWDVGVRAPSGWHLSSFTDTIDLLPAFIERRLRECVQLPMTDAQTVERDRPRTIDACVVCVPAAAFPQTLNGKPC
jgi:hypothetical protein